MTPGHLFIVATPIGNLGDLSSRAVEVLKTCDLMAAEDTRHSGHLAERFDIQTPRISFHAHSDTKKILEKLRAGKNVALVSDAGTPGISDPGTALVSAARAENFLVSPIPGACAFVAALCASGLPTDHFEFFGFIPHKKGRQTFFKNLAILEHTALFYESTHRIHKCLGEMTMWLPTRAVVVARELTKHHEEFLTGTALEILALLEKCPEKTRGEFVVLVAGKNFQQEKTG